MLFFAAARSEGVWNYRVADPEIFDSSPDLISGAEGLSNISMLERQGQRERKRQLALTNASLRLLM
jgi:hypothetical protein